jgi:hypothetical protein
VFSVGSVQSAYKGSEESDRVSQVVNIVNQGQAWALLDSVKRTVLNNQPLTSETKGIEEEVSSLRSVF